MSKNYFRIIELDYTFDFDVTSKNPSISSIAIGEQGKRYIVNMEDWGAPTTLTPKLDMIAKGNGSIDKNLNM